MITPSYEEALLLRKQLEDIDEKSDILPPPGYTFLKDGISKDPGFLHRASEAILRLTEGKIDFLITTAPSLLHPFPTSIQTLQVGEKASEKSIVDLLVKMGVSGENIEIKGELLRFITYKEFLLSLPFGEVEEIKWGYPDELYTEHKEKKLTLPKSFGDMEEAAKTFGFSIYLIDPERIHLVLEAISPELRKPHHKRLKERIKEIASKFNEEEDTNFRGDLEKIKKHIQELYREGYVLLIATNEENLLRTIKELFPIEAEEIHPPVKLSRKTFTGPIVLLRSPWLLGGRIEKEMVEVLTDKNLLGRTNLVEEDIEKSKFQKSPPGTRKIKKLSNLKKGDTVIHPGMGIAVFRGLKRLYNEDFVELEFEDGKAFIPISDIAKLYKFHSDNPPPPTSMGSRAWKVELQRLRKSVEAFVKDLLNLHIVREISRREPYPPDGEEMWQFIAEFPHQETPDQKRAWQEVKKDLESDHPMDRLILGDTGYGKTEIAMRAAFKVVLGGKQVAFMVPTTILAIQQYDRFRERFKNFPVNIKLLSRFTPKEEVRKILKDLKEGKIDIIIGTHRLLSPDVKFRDLGLIIVDDEHRFGVKHKEKLKMLKKDVDYLGMSATPIPRTFHMALHGIKEFSVVETPPPGRKQIKVEVEEFSLVRAEKYIKEHLESNPQEKLFWVEPRIEDLQKIKDFLESIAGEDKVVIAHGRMKPEELEESLYRFVTGEARIMLSTAIIEAGIDLEDVDLIIINNAHRFGMSQLYQLRGRVGRREKPARAVFFYPKGKITPSARKRLKALERAESGFEIAYADMEMRGPGTLFGYAQHGHYKYINSELYIEMINEELARARGEELLNFEDIKLNLNSKLFLPEKMSDRDKIKFYRAIFSATTPEELHHIKKQILEKFGELPQETENLLRVREFLILVSPLLKSFEEKELIEITEPENAIILNARNTEQQKTWKIKGNLENLNRLLKIVKSDLLQNEQRKTEL